MPDNYIKAIRDLFLKLARENDWGGTPGLWVS